MENLGLGILGGWDPASLVLAPALIAGEAHISGTPKDQPSFSVVVFVVFLLAFGAMGEELMMRGYGFQILLANVGTWATIIPCGLVLRSCIPPTPTPRASESPIPPALASFSGTLSYAAATFGCPRACISAGMLPSPVRGERQRA